MDDHDEPNFDWKNTPRKRHPAGINCTCPACREIKENIPMNRGRLKIKLCPDHYRVWLNEILPIMPFPYRIMAKLFMKLGILQVREIPYMQSEQCYYCKFGSGNRDNKAELPPVV